MRRRDFIKSAGCFVVSAGVGSAFGCGDDDDERAARGDAGPDAGPAAPGSYSFAYGVASGDPRPDSVMLWTRVQRKGGGDDPIPLTLEITPSGGKSVAMSYPIEASADADYTVRVLVEGLQPDTTYQYKFIAGEDESRTGRTWTAPKPDADVPIAFAWVACQDYSGGFYGAYRSMLNDDSAADAGDQLRFVLHVGDFIYETRNASFQAALDADLQPLELDNPDGKPRVVPAFPSGGGKLENDGEFAQTVDDYRHLYKTFLSDADLQDARARWPFVNVWDDHEFSDDCWQTQTNYTNEKSFDEPSQKRRVAASQAWFEYIPAMLSESEGADGVDSAARDFKPVDVEDVAYGDPIDVDEANNAKAIGAITIYRRLRFGKHVDLLLTDSRSYRSDHALPEDITFGNPIAFHPRAGLPLLAVNTFDAGKTANGGNPPESVDGYMNTRRDSAPGTLLGAVQKQWFKDALAASSATFKVWGNSVPLLRFLLDATTAPLFPGDLLLSNDAWDGYPSERRELMKFIKDKGIRNVVSLSGDHHAHFAGLVYDDYDADDPTPVMADFCTAGISSTSEFASIAGAVDSAIGPDPAPVLKDVLRLIVFDATEVGGTRKAAPNLNTLLRFGGASALAMADSNDLETAIAERKDSVNPHLRYTDAEANGYGLALFGAKSATLTLVTIELPIVDRGQDGAKVRGKAVFTLPLQGTDVALDEPELSGEKPFPES